MVAARSVVVAGKRSWLRPSLVAPTGVNSDPTYTSTPAIPATWSVRNTSATVRSSCGSSQRYS